MNRRVFVDDKVGGYRHTNNEFSYIMNKEFEECPNCGRKVMLTAKTEKSFSMSRRPESWVVWLDDGNSLISGSSQPCFVPSENSVVIVEHSML